MSTTNHTGALAKAYANLWQFLTERVRSRASVELEQVRNEATAQAITLLPDGAELWETEPNGRTRIIRMPAKRDAGTLPPR